MHYSPDALEALETFEILQTLRDRRELPPLRIEKVNGQVVTTYAEYLDAQLRHIGQPVTYTIGGIDVEIPAIPMREIPVRFQMGEIVSVLPDSDAERQGIVSGDTIVSVDGDAEVDPLKLPQILLHKVNAGQQSVELVIRNASGEEQTRTVELAPTRIMPELFAMSMRDPMGSTALGLSWNVDPVIAGVCESVPFDLRGISGEQPIHGSPSPGDRVVSVEFINSVNPLRRNSFSHATSEGLLFHAVGTGVDIPYIFAHLLQEVQLSSGASRFAWLFGGDEADEEQERVLSVRLTLESPNGTTKIADLPILESTDWFNTERGYFLRAEQETFTAAGIGDAFSRGVARTMRYGLLVYSTLQALLDGSVSPRALNGPVGIVEIIYRIAQSSWVEYLMILALISVNLAVINMLPIPPLDGGHVVFLTYEGIFGKPPNEMIQVILSYFGLALVVLLLLWTVSLDLRIIPRW
jgi:regulator of sigma E protease